MNDLNQDGSWANFGWDNSAPYVKWASGEPDNDIPDPLTTIDDDCVSIQPQSDGLSVSSDFKCSKEIKGFICEMPKPCSTIIRTVRDL